MAIYFQILWHRLYVMVLVTVVSGLVAGAVTLQMDPIYKAESRLLVAPFGLGNPDLATYRYSEQLATTFSLVLDSDAVTAELEEELGVGQASEDYDIALIPNSELLQITVRDTNPRHAQQTANVLAEILVARLQSRYGVNLANIEGTLSTTLNNLEDEIQSLIVERAELLNEDRLDNVRIAEVERLIEVRALSLTTLLTSYNEALIDQATQDNLISIFEEATLPVEPAGPSLVLNVLAGILAGGFGSLMLVFLLEMLHPRVYVDEQIEALLGGKIMGHIPTIQGKHQDNVFAQQPIFHKEKGQLVVKSGAGDRVASEAFRRLRTKINKAFLGKEHKTLLFVSAKPDDGKSTVTLNVAVAMARSFKRVLLIDCDIYQSKIHHKLGMKNEQGLVDVLAEKLSFAEAVQTSDEPNLDVLTTGVSGELSPELLSSPQMKAFLEEVNRDYDYVILDSAPLLVVSDTSAIIPFVDGVLFVVESQAAVAELKRACTEMATDDLGLFGIVVNRIKRSRMDGLTIRYLK